MLELWCRHERLPRVEWGCVYASLYPRDSPYVHSSTTAVGRGDQAEPMGAGYEGNDAQAFPAAAKIDGVIQGSRTSQPPRLTPRIFCVVKSHCPLWTVSLLASKANPPSGLKDSRGFACPLRARLATAGRFPAPSARCRLERKGFRSPWRGRRCLASGQAGRGRVVGLERCRC